MKSKLLNLKLNKNFKFQILNFRKGFTMVELLIVIVIIGVLATIFVSNYLGVKQRARDTQRKSNLRQIQAALELVRIDTGSYPVSLYSTSCPASSSLVAGTVTYMQKIPCDPLSSDISSKLPEESKKAGNSVSLARVLKTTFLEKFQNFPPEVMAQAASFPIVESTATSQETTLVSTHNITLPSGIVPGETLIAIIVIGQAPVVTWPSGWTQFFNRSITSTLRLAAAWKKATGAEGATVDPTSSSAYSSTHASYRISGASDPTVQAPQGSAGVTSEGSENPNPDSLTPSGGAKDYLWLAIEGHQLGITTVGIPASYTNQVSLSRIGTARRSLNAVSENPAAFTLSDGAFWIAGTLVVHPAVSPPSSPTPSPTSIPTSTPIPTPTPSSSGNYNNGNYYYAAPVGGASYTICACLENTNDTQGLANATCSFGVSPACSSGKFFVLESQ